MSNKTLKLLFTIIVSVATLLVCTASSNAALLGDVADEDNLVTANDARTILRASVGLDTLTEEQMRLADTDEDGKITASDARTALRISVGLDEALHYYEEEVITAPTCTEAGLMKRTCTECEDVQKVAIEARHYYEEEIIAAPTCTEAGLMKQTCTECEDVQEIAIEALGHQLSAYEIITTVSCTEDGVERRACTREGCEHTEDKITPASHVPGINPPTCTEDQLCTRCNGVVKAKLGHTTDWGVCGTCKVFNTAKYATEAATIKEKFNEAKTAFDAAYAINSYNTMLDGISWKVLPNTKAAKPDYLKAKAAYEAALAACGEIPEFASIKALLTKNLANINGVLAQVELILAEKFFDTRNFEELVWPLEELNDLNSDSITATNKKLSKLIVW